jgi:hypothetical protein
MVSVCQATFMSFVYSWVERPSLPVTAAAQTVSGSARLSRTPSRRPGWPLSLRVD